MKRNPALFLITGLLFTAIARAGEPDVVDVKVDCPARDRCDFSVTVRHSDEGWDHYADRWEVLGPDGAMIASRTLLHPHVHEQPFTRSLSNVAIPDGIDRVIVRAHDSVHGYGGEEMEIVLPSR